MNCPSCGGVRLLMTERQGIEIDYCPQCRGVWLDRGELDKIIDRSVGAGPAGAPPPRREEDDDRRGYTERREHSHGPHDTHHGGYYKKKKREGFLSDLFDFD